jgi:hypothetical protein
MMGQLMQHFVQTQQQDWGMGCMNGKGMGGMQNIQNMQHRYPGERESERERERDVTKERERERARVRARARGTGLGRARG